MRIMTIRVPDKIQDDLAKKAELMGISRNALVVFIINNWMYGDTKGADIKKIVEE